jgi:hypothetical protein
LYCLPFRGRSGYDPVSEELKATSTPDVLLVSFSKALRIANVIAESNRQHHHSLLQRRGSAARLPLPADAGI